jgi:photosynthetic reaction center H subunit
MLNAHFDLAFVSLYAFWLFFLGLVIYLLKEGKREGYPMESPRSKYIFNEGWPAMPSKTKVFNTGHPQEPRRAERDLTGLAVQSFVAYGAPLVPTGNAMKDGIGPAAWAERADVVDITYDDHGPKIVPLRTATGYYVAEDSPDPRGMDVVCADGKVAGKVVDVWVDRSEYIARYLEAEVALAGGGTRRVLFPMFLAVVDATAGVVKVASVLASQFAEAPAIRNPDQITLLEEDKVSAYFGGGHMYATPNRAEPYL